MLRTITSLLYFAGIWSASAATPEFEPPTVTEKFEFSASNGISTDPIALGFDLALAGDLLAAGAPSATDGRINQVGAVIVFDLHTGSELRRIFASDRNGAARLGRSLDIDGSTIVAAAPFQGSNDVGAAYVFDINTGRQLRKMQPAIGARFRNTRLGHSGSAIVGDRVLLGTSAGPVRSVFLFDHVTGQQLQNLRAPEGEDPGSIGYSVALTERFIISAEFVFDANSGEFSHKLKPPEGYRLLNLATDGTSVLAGGYSESEEVSVAFLFDIETGELLQTFNYPGTEELDPRLGASVALHGDLVLLGAPGIYRGVSEPPPKPGEAFLFKRDGRLLATLRPSDPAENDSFGRQVSINDRWIAVSAASPANSRRGDGAAYVYELAPLNEVEFSLSASTPHQITAAPGEIEHTLQIENRGPGRAIGIELAIGRTLLDGVSIGESTPTAGEVDGEIWQIPSLDAGAVASLTVRYSLDPSVASGEDLITTSATFSQVAQPLAGDRPEPVAVGTSVIAPGDLEISMPGPDPALVLQSGLFLHRIEVENSGALPIAGYRIEIVGLPDGVSVVGASGESGDGNPYFDIASHIAPGETQALGFEFNAREITSELAAPAYSVTAVFTETPSELVDESAASEILRMVRLPGDEDILIEFTTQPGVTYSVIYSSDMKTWKQAGAATLASGTRMQWIDYGLPKTDSHPGSVEQRYYRILSGEKSKR